jgi:putative flippase GtrA
MRKSDVIAVLILGEIAAWLILSVAKGFLKPEFYDKIHNLLIIGLPIVFPILCLIFIYISFLIAKRIVVIRQVAKFILVGGLNTLVDWGVLALLIFVFRNSFSIGSNDVLLNIFSVTIVFYSLFKGISFILATINSYIWNKFWTFRRKTKEKLGKEFLQFIVISVIGFLINVGVASIVFRFISPFAGLGIDQWAIICAAIATAVSMIWNFLGYKFIVFDTRNSKIKSQNAK